jgi:hypothetical protein
MGSVAAGTSFSEIGPVADAVVGRGVLAEGVGWAGEATPRRVALLDVGGRRRVRMVDSSGRGEKASGERDIVG